MNEIEVIETVSSIILNCFIILFQVLMLNVLVDIRKNQEKINILFERQIRNGEIIRFK